MSAIDEIALVAGMRARRRRFGRDVHTRATVGEMVGIYLREASVLLLVFGFVLDHEHEPALPVIALALALFVVGVVLERIRR